MGSMNELSYINHLVETGLPLEEAERRAHAAFSKVSSAAVPDTKIGDQLITGLAAAMADSMGSEDEPMPDVLRQNLPTMRSVERFLQDPEHQQELPPEVTDIPRET